MWARGMGSPAMAVKDMGVMVERPDTHWPRCCSSRCLTPPSTSILDTYLPPNTHS